MTDPDVSLLASSEHRQLSRGFHPGTLEEQGKQPLKRALNCRGEKRCPEVPRDSRRHRGPKPRLTRSLRGCGAPGAGWRMENPSLAAWWAGTALSHPRGSAPPQIPHCNLIQGILPVPRHLLDVPRPLPATPQHFPVTSRPFPAMASPGHITVLPGHAMASPDSTKPHPGISWPHCDTSWPLLASPWHLPALVAPCPAWKLSPACPSQGSPHFNPPGAHRVGKAWDHPQDHGWRGQVLPPVPSSPLSIPYNAASFPSHPARLAETPLPTQPPRKAILELLFFFPPFSSFFNSFFFLTNNPSPPIWAASWVPAAPRRTLNVCFL